MSSPNGAKIRLLDARCPTCTHLLFKAAENIELTAQLEIKCPSCGTITAYRPGKIRLTENKNLSKH